MIAVTQRLSQRRRPTGADVKERPNCCALKDASGKSSAWLEKLPGTLTSNAINSLG